MSDNVYFLTEQLERVLEDQKQELAEAIRKEDELKRRQADAITEQQMIMKAIRETQELLDWQYEKKEGDG